MARIDDLAAAFFSGNKRLEDSGVGNGTATRTEMGTATSDSQNGRVYVVIGDETIPGETLDGTKGTNAVEVPTTTAVKEGDQVIVTLVGSEGVKTPTVTGVVGYGDQLEETIQTIESSSDYFFDDSSGVHMTTTPRDASTGANILATTQNIIMRIASQLRMVFSSTGLELIDQRSGDSTYFKALLSSHSLASGSGASATGSNSAAFGAGVTAESPQQLVIGAYNVADTNSRYDVICGDGAGDNSRHNAWMIKKDGHVVDSDGGSTLMAYELFSSNGTKATDGGTLTQSLSGFKYVTVFFHSHGTPYPNDGYDTYGSASSIVTSGSTNSIDCSINKVSYNNQASPVYYTFHCQVGMFGTTWHANSSECGYASITGTTCKSGTGCRIYIDKIVGYK